MGRYLGPGVGFIPGGPGNAGDLRSAERRGRETRAECGVKYMSQNVPPAGIIPSYLAHLQLRPSIFNAQYNSFLFIYHTQFTCYILG
jgi:hypothetical protein